MPTNTIRRYTTVAGQDVYGEWLDALKDRKGKAQIQAKVGRLEAGNFKACKPLREGVSELKIDFGPGYRVYYGVIGKLVILLLCGGDKSSQDEDIDRAVEYLADFKRRAK